MGTTGRFGGGGHGLTGPKHIWYDTDYSELYKGLAVVIGFFLFLVLLLLIFILISYLRKWYRLKKNSNSNHSNDINNNDDNSNDNDDRQSTTKQHQQLAQLNNPLMQTQQQHKASLHSMNQLQSLPQFQQTSGGKKSSLTFTNNGKNDQPMLTGKYCKKHSRVGLPPSSANPSANNHNNNNNANSSLPQTPISKSAISKKLSTPMINPNIVSISASSSSATPPTLPSPLLQSSHHNLIQTQPQPLSMTPSANIELIHDPNIVMTTNSGATNGVSTICGTIDEGGGGGGGGGGGSGGSSSIHHHHHHHHLHHVHHGHHYQEFPLQTQPTQPAHIVSMIPSTATSNDNQICQNQQQHRKDSRSSLQLSAIPTNVQQIESVHPCTVVGTGGGGGGRPSLSTITLS